MIITDRLQAVKHLEHPDLLTGACSSVDRISVYETGGQRFESFQAHQQ